MKKVFDRVVLLLTGVSLALVILALVDFVLHPLARDFTFHSVFYRAATIFVLTPLTLLVGFLIIRRVPGNIVGPLLILWAGALAFGSLRVEIGEVAFALFALYENFGWLALFAMVMHFPNGKIYPPGAAAWLYPGLGIGSFMGLLVFLSTASTYAGLANPFSLPAMHPLYALLNWLTLLVSTPAILMAMASPVLRYRSGTPLERQQIKWLTLFGAILTVGTVLGFVIYPLLTGNTMMGRRNDLFSLFFFLYIGLFPPLAIGVAVLRHRLWDIDLLIRQTLVYSILTVILALMYFGSVAGLQRLWMTLFDHHSPAAIVLSTLFIAASITPLRKHIQQRIDRRFYRHKYNAEKVLATFSTSLRMEVDMAHLTGSVLTVVEETMKPDHVSLWLRRLEHPSSDRQAEATATQE